MQLKEIATPYVITLSMDDDVRLALKTITSRRIHNLVVKDAQGDHWVISIADILESFTEGDWRSIRLAALPKKPLRILPLSTTLVTASTEMVLGENIIGVADEAGRLSGVVTHKDITDALEISLEGAADITIASLVQGSIAPVVDGEELLANRLPLLNASATDCMIVLREGKPEGIITKRDVVRLLNDDKRLDVPVGDVMSAPLFSLQGEISINSALIVMQNKHFRRAVVLDEAGALLGVVTQKAIIALLYGFAARQERKLSLEMQHLLSGEVERRNRELEAYKNNLQAMVEERTAQLKAANARLHEEVEQRTLLQERNAALAHVLSESLNEIYVFAAKTLRFLWANKGARKNSGYSLKELKNLTPYDLKKKYTETTFKAMLEPLESGKQETLVFTAEHQRKDGSSYPVEVHLQKNLYDKEEVYIAIIIDLTERWEHQAKLEEANARLQKEMLQRKEAADVMRNLVEGTASETGEDFFRQLARALGEALGMRFVLVGELMSSGKRVKTHAFWKNGAFVADFEYDLAGTPCENVVGKALCSYTKEVQQLFPDDAELVALSAQSYIGSPLFDSEGNALGVIAVLDDRPLSEKKLESAESVLSIFANRAAAEIERLRTQEALEKSEELYRSLFDNANSGIVMLGPDKKFIRVNRAFEEFVGYSQEELTQMTPREITAPEDMGLAQQVIETETRGEAERQSFEIRCLCKDGTKKWASIFTRIIRDAHGEVLYSHAIINDITLQKEAEAKLLLVNESLEQKVEEATQKRLANERMMLQQSKFATMGEMVSMIAHQWRQPLAAIASVIADIQIKLELDSLDPAYLKQHTEDVNSYLQFMSKTIDDFRNFYRYDVEKSYQPLSQTMETCVGIVKGNFSVYGIALHTDYDTHEPIASYHNELMQVFLSILKNAQDVFIEKKMENGAVTVRIEEVSAGTQRVSIADNGGGIPEELMERIFEPYFSTKEELNGTGLGLYMSKTVVEEHCGGRIYARNRDSGAEFVIELES